jgi:hypothetical protein
MTGHPVHKDSKPAKRAGLDPASRSTIYRFGFTVVLFLVWLAPQGDRVSFDILGTAMMGAAAITALLATLFGEAFRSPSLNRWDETLAYLGIAALVRAMS